MYRNLQLANTRAIGCGPWPLGRAAWLACSILVGLLGLALHLMQAAANPPVPGQGPGAVIQSLAVEQVSGMLRIQPACGDAQSHASCGEVESSEGADEVILAGFGLMLGAVQPLQLAWVLDPAGLAGVKPLLRPPRYPG